MLRPPRRPRITTAPHLRSSARTDANAASIDQVEMITVRSAARPTAVCGVCNAPASTRVYEFFCTVTCACNESPRSVLVGGGKHLLVVTSLPFCMPAYLLLRQGTYFIGACAAALFVTSVVYHTIHKGWIRAPDVLLVWLIGGVGTVRAVMEIATAPTAPSTLPLSIALGLVLCLNLINALPCCHEPHRNGEVIKLQWHAVVHCITTACLTLFAVGFGS